jgi:hypothetical protein
VTRFRRVSAFVGIVVLLAGCRVDTRIEVTMHKDGSGTLRSIITVDADAVLQMGGTTSLEQTVTLDDVRAAGWTISQWSQGAAASQTVTLSHPFADQRKLARLVLDLAGPRGILQNPIITRDRGWFGSHDALSIVVDLRSPTLDVVSDAPLVARLKAAGADPGLLQAEIAVKLKTALHVSVVVHLPGGRTQTFLVGPGKVETVRLADGGTNWDHVVKFGIGVSLALLAFSFFLAAGVGARRNRRRSVQRLTRDPQPERTPLM